MPHKVQLTGFQIEVIGPIALHFASAAAFLLSLSLFTAKNLYGAAIPFWLLALSWTTFFIVTILAFGPMLQQQVSVKIGGAIEAFNATILDLFAHLICFLLYPFKQTYFDPKKEELANQTPLLLIHGYLLNSSCMIYQRYHYRNAGFKNIYTVNLGHPFHSIEEFAAVVKERIRSIKQATGKNEICLIGHSMGGLVAAYYILHMAKEEATIVKKLITIGTPFEGTAMSPFGIGRCVKQMSRHNPFVLTLTRELAKNATPCLLQGSSIDLIVIPGSSATPANYGFRNLRLHSNLGHVALLFSDNVIKENIAFLRK